VGACAEDSGGLGIQMMRCPPHQHHPPLAHFRIDLVGLDRDLVVGVLNTSTQVLVKDGSHVAKTSDALSITSATGSAVSPYRVLKTAGPSRISDRLHAFGLTQEL
jgi:hypothetical protein